MAKFTPIDDTSMEDEFNLSKNTEFEDKFYNFFLTGICDDRRPKLWINQLLDNDFEVNYSGGSDLILHDIFYKGGVKGCIHENVADFLFDIKERFQDIDPLKYHGLVEYLNSLTGTTKLNALTLDQKNGIKEALGTKKINKMRLFKSSKISEILNSNLQANLIEESTVQDVINALGSEDSSTTKCGGQIQRFLTANEGSIKSNPSYLKFLNKFFSIRNDLQDKPKINRDIFMNSFIPELNKKDSKCCTGFNSIKVRVYNEGAMQKDLNTISITDNNILREYYQHGDDSRRETYIKGKGSEDKRECLWKSNDDETKKTIFFNPGVKVAFDSITREGSSMVKDILQMFSNSTNQKLEYHPSDGKLHMKYVDNDNKPKSVPITLEAESFFVNPVSFDGDKRHQCGSFQLKATDQECGEFRGYLQKIKENQKWDDNFEKMISTSSYWKGENDGFDASQVYPYFAVKLLTALNFYETTVSTSSGQIRSVETVATWSSRLEQTVAKKSNKDANEQKNLVNAIRDNTQLGEYLLKIVAIIQDFPAILNEGYGDNSKGNKRVGAANSKDNNGLRWNLQPRGNDYSSPVQDNIFSFGSQYKDLFTERPFPITFVVPNGTNLTGGDWFQKSGIMENIPNTWGAALMSQMYEDSLSLLKQRNKDLSSQDKSDITRMLNNLRKLEEKLFKVVSIIQKFQEYVVSNPNDNKSETFKIDEINKKLGESKQSLIQKYKKKELTMEGVLRALDDIKNDNNNNNNNDSGNVIGI